MKKTHVTALLLMLFSATLLAQPDTLDLFEQFEQNSENAFEQVKSEEERMFQRFKENEMRWHELTTGNSVSAYDEIPEESLAAANEDKANPQPPQAGENPENSDEPEDQENQEAGDAATDETENNVKEAPEPPDHEPLDPQLRIPQGNPLTNNPIVTSPFGYRNHPTLKRRRFHSGIDISAAGGSKIRATADGEVLRAESFSSYGNFVLIRHNTTYRTAYAHCSKLLVEKGQQIKKGDVIGLVGSTGRATGDHLHYEVIKNRKKVNPQTYL